MFSSFGATVNSFSVQGWVFLSIYSFIHCSFSTEYSVPAMVQAGCEALKTEGRANPGILPEAGHPPPREPPAQCRVTSGQGQDRVPPPGKLRRGVGRSSHMLRVWRMLQEPLEEGASTVPPASQPGGFSLVSWWPRGNKPAALRTRNLVSLIPGQCPDFLLQNLRGA